MTRVSRIGLLHFIFMVSSHSQCSIKKSFPIIIEMRRRLHSMGYMGNTPFRSIYSWQDHFWIVCMKSPLDVMLCHLLNCSEEVCKEQKLTLFKTDMVLPIELLFIFTWLFKMFWRSMCLLSKTSNINTINYGTLPLWRVYKWSFKYAGLRFK